MERPGDAAHERSFAGIRDVEFAADAHGRVIDEARVEAEEYRKTYVWYPQRQGRIDLVFERAKSSGKAADPVLRQEMMKLHSFHRAAGWTAERAKAEQALGRPPIGGIDRQAGPVGGGPTM
ncbi:MAG: hypothetical protein R2706_08360 [Acidimicrobiales bacterium]